MNYYEFDAQPTLGINTNGVNMVYELLNSNDRAWLTQGTDSVHRWACAGANGYFAAVAKSIQGEEDKKYLEDHAKALDVICNAVSEFVNKEYDVIIPKTITKQKTVYVDVPYEVKVGLFKKETRYRKEQRNETYYENETNIYKGWLIERLYRQEGYGSSAEVLFFDYCLGANGKTYLVVSKKDDTSNNPVILECVCYSPAFLNNHFCNIYSAAIGGVIGVLDAIPLNENDPQRKIHLTLDDEYYYNFPVQINDGHDYPFGFLDGVIARLINLLDENGKIECCKKYEAMKKFIFPEDASISQANIDSTQKSTSLQQEPLTTDASLDQPKYIDFDSLVVLAAKVASREPYTKDKDSFLAEPSSAFLEMFLTNRVIAADELAKRYPNFDKLAKAIINNHNNGLSGQMLFDERELATNISNSYEKDEEGDADTFLLLTAYHCFLNQRTTDERTILIRNMMVDRVIERPYIYAEWKDLLIITVLWYSDKNGFQEAVLKKFQAIKDTPEYNEGIRKYNFNSFIGAGYKVIIDNRDNPDNEFLRTILVYRRKIAENIQSHYPEFNKVIQAMDVTDNALMNSGDFSGSFINESNVICDYISEGSDILDNQDYLILGAAIMSFMGRFNKPEENDGRLFITRIESIGEEIYTLPRISLFCAALWYADYNNYKQLLTEYINDPKN